MRLQDQVAIVTGAASGIGKEIARKFAAEGAKVVIADLNGHAAEATAAELGGAGRALGVGMDVTDEAQVEAGVAKAAEAFGRIDILVSNAGIQIVAPVHEFEFAKWKQLLAVHLDGAFLTTRAALRQMYAPGRRRQHRLHRLGAFEGGVGAEGALRHREARAGGPGEGRRQGGRGAWGARQRGLPRLRPHAAGRQADPGAGAGNSGSARTRSSRTSC